MLVDEHGFTYTWKPHEPPFLVKGNFKVTCYRSDNVLLFFTNLLQENSQDNQSSAEGNLQSSPQPAKKGPAIDTNIIEQAGGDSAEEPTDPEMPGLQDGSSDEEASAGWRTATNKNKNNKKQGSSSSSPPVPPVPARRNPELRSALTPRSSG